MTWDQMNHMPVAVFQEGSFFGELEVYRNTQRAFTCMAVTELDVLTLEKKDFKKLFFKYNPKLGKHFIFQMNESLHNLENMMDITRLLFQQFDNLKNEQLISRIQEDRRVLQRLSLNSSLLQIGSYWE